METVYVPPTSNVGYRVPIISNSACYKKTILTKLDYFLEKKILLNSGVLLHQS